VVDGAPYLLDITAVCSDDFGGGGIDSVIVFYAGPSGTSYRMTDDMQPGATPNSFESTTNLAGYFAAPQSGIYYVTQLLVRDSVGNEQAYAQAQMVEFGWSTQFELINANQDSTPPSCQAAGFQQHSVVWDPADTLAIATLSVGDCVDNVGGTGIASLQSFYFVKSDSFAGGDQITDMTPRGYNIFQLSANLEFDEFSASSTFTIVGILIYDNSGNSILLGTCGPFATAFAGTPITGGCQAWNVDSSSSELSGGQVAGVVIGVLVLLGLLIVLALFIYDKYFRGENNAIRVLVPGLNAESRGPFKDDLGIPLGDREPFPDLSNDGSGGGVGGTG